MKTEYVDRRPLTTIQPESRRKLLHIIDKLARHTDVPEFGRWKRLSSEAQWNHLVSQVCVMGSAAPIEEVKRGGNLSAFQDALSLAELDRRKYRPSYIEGVLKGFKATRFKKKAAKRIATAATTPTLVQNGKVVLLKGLPQGGVDDVRDELMRRSGGVFGRKSISDLMITVGLSDDVVALDQRIVGVLNDHLGYARKFGGIQASRPQYLSVEDCLRGVCHEAGISLARLDRALFEFAGLTAMEYLVRFDLPPN
jgi:thermostable 8-oxoguanine DNA glycosylase